MSVPPRNATRFSPAKIVSAHFCVAKSWGSSKSTISAPCPAKIPLAVCKAWIVPRPGVGHSGAVTKPILAPLSLNGASGTGASSSNLKIWARSSRS